MGQLDLFPAPQFGGLTSDANPDEARLSTALEKVYALMRDGRWRTLAAIARACGCSESGVGSAARPAQI
jgi:hypothetical protein